jgi:hypothetical protein
MGVPAAGHCVVLGQEGALKAGLVKGPFLHIVKNVDGLSPILPAPPFEKFRGGGIISGKMQAHVKTRRALSGSGQV